MRAFNLRGTNGSGKTYVAKALLAETNARVAQLTPKVGIRKQKPLVYEGKYKGFPIFFFGSYETACGGCDTIQPFSILPGLLDHAMQKKSRGLVFYEGLLVSHMIGSVGEVAKKYNDKHVMGFLDTPLKTCIERVMHRRIERGTTKPFDPERTLKPDYQRVLQAKANALSQGFRVVTILHDSAIADVKDWLDTLLQEQMP
jgi:adenylate kinase family enzyme